MKFEPEAYCDDCGRGALKVADSTSPDLNTKAWIHLDDSGAPAPEIDREDHDVWPVAEEPEGI